MYVDAIKFNHDQGSATNDALNIRRNASQSISVPEWQHGISVNPEDSVTAYSIAETQKNTITIHVRFKRTDPTIEKAFVRAIDSRAHVQGCLYWLLTKLGAKVDPGPPFHCNVLGEVKAREIEFNPDGFTDFLAFELEGVTIWDRGVTINDVEWLWQFKTSQDSDWSGNMTKTTRHRIYVVLSTPTAPWTQTPTNAINLPWTDVLNYACRWADRSKITDDAACRITKEIFNLGPQVIEYDCVGNGGTAYSIGDFDCTEFLERLQGGPGLGKYVNCTDCATILSTFSNILGCDLWQSRMGYYFDLNPILAIGSNVWQPACGWSGFSYHEVAWKGNCDVNDEVFDACLKLDGDADPTAAPHTELLPCKMIFGNTGDGLYRNRLEYVSPGGSSNCNPQPQTTRKRRSVS